MFNDSTNVIIAIAIHDGVYLVDFSVQTVDLTTRPTNEDRISDYVIEKLGKYRQNNTVKLIGAGLPYDLMKRSPRLCSRLWLDLDVVPISIVPRVEEHEDETDRNFWDSKLVDEQADSMARKCIMTFGPSLAPLLQVGFRGLVEVDEGFQVRLLTASDYEKTCSKATWDATMKYISSLKASKTKIAFFSSTPQGGGVALMRHALVRFAKVMGVDLCWYLCTITACLVNELTQWFRYVPKPRPGVFRITKTMHNILQGVSTADEVISAKEKNDLVGWIHENAERYWLSPGGPLRPPDEGGADVIIVSVLRVWCIL